MAIRRFVVVSLLALLSACGPDNFKGTDISNVNWGGDFTLTTHTGQRIGPGDLQGKVLVIFFGYTDCPDICGPTLARLAQVLRQLGTEAQHVQVLFITVDPKRDTASKLAGFVPKFHSSFIGLTGSEQELADVARDYRIATARTGGQVNHGGTIFVKNSRGKLRLMFKEDAKVEDITHDLKMLLRRE